MKTLKLLILFLSIVFIATACPGDDPVENNTVCSPENITGTCDEGKVCKNGMCILIDNACSPTNLTGTCPTGKKCSAEGVCVDVVEGCNPACKDWEDCDTSKVECQLKAGRCNVKADCTGADEICNDSNYCEVHKECTPACNDLKDCNFSEGKCEFKAGKCDLNSDCPVDKPVCDKPNHNCITQDQVCTPACSDWKTCNAGTCELKAGKCDRHSDCIGDEKCTAEHECKVPQTCNPGCEYWEECDTGVCNLKDSYCAADADCNDATKECSMDTHKCAAKTVNPCTGITCTNGTCAVFGGTTAKCVCDNGYHNENDLTCVINNVTNPCEGITCNNHGTCAVNDQNEPICACTTGYHPGADNISCVSNDLCVGKTCENWQECNSNNGNCELKSGFCNAKSDCPNADTYICTVDHTCESTAITCNPACEYWESCVSNNNCQLKDTYCNTGTCGAGKVCNTNHRCEDDVCVGQACSGHGTCVSNNGIASCDCATGYIQNGLACDLDPACSVANPTGACANACDSCIDGSCQNPSGYKCDKTFNAKCNPATALVNGQHPDCNAGLGCAKDPDDETQGYCTITGCSNDAECTSLNYPERSIDKFYCRDYGVSDNGACIKVTKTCSNPPRSITTGGSCENACASASCVPGDICVFGKCSNECTAGGNECAAGYGCINIGDDTFPVLRCVEAAARGEVCSAKKPCMGTNHCLGTGEEGSDMFCFQSCTVASENSAECGGEKCNDLGDGNFYCSAPKTKNRDEMCTIADQCVNGNICLTSGDNSFCFKTCTTASNNSAECGGTACNDLGGGTFYCDTLNPNHTGEECGAGCDSNSICLNTGFCYKRCAAASNNSAECNNQKCQDIGGGNLFCYPTPANKFEECAYSGCSDNLICITSDGESYQCLDKCTPGSNCSGEKTCNDVGEGNGYCDEECFNDFACDYGSSCLSTLVCQ